MNDLDVKNELCVKNHLDVHFHTIVGYLAKLAKVKKILYFIPHLIAVLPAPLLHDFVFALGGLGSNTN